MMTLGVLLTVALSLMSLAISLWAAVRANDLSGYNIRLGRRLELHRLIQELDREMLHDPSLASMFRSWSGTAAERVSIADVKQEVYVSMYLNLFEAAHSIFRETSQLSSAELEVVQAWQQYRHWFFEECIPVADIWRKQRDMYYASFRNSVDDELARPAP